MAGAQFSQNTIDENKLKQIQEQYNKDQQQKQASPGAGKAMPTVTYTTVKSQEPIVKTPYQSNVSQPVKQQTWYKGDQPTVREALGQMYKITQQDPARGKELQQQFKSRQNDPTSMYWSPYLKPTTRELDTLSKLGYDISNINDDWYAATADLENYLIHNGATNSPTKPGKKATAEQQAAYARDKVASAQPLTNKAKEELAALKEEIEFLANWGDRNYSDDEIYDYIYGKDDADFKKKYPTLAKMDESLQPGKALLELNEAIPYSKDWVYGTIWASRNDGGTGNMYTDMAMSALGEGNTWQDNQEISFRRKNAPYTVGSTTDDVLLYWNIPSYDKAWLEANKPDERDKTAVDLWNRAWDAADFTETAKTELEEFNALLDRKLSNATDPDAFMKKVDDWLAKGFGDKKFTNLNKLDKSTQKIGKLVDTSEAIPFSRYDIRMKVEEACAKNGWDGQRTMEYNGMPAVSDQEALATKARDQKVTDAANDYGGDMLPSEQNVFDYTPSSQYDTVNAGLTGIADGDPTALVKNNESTTTTNYANSLFSVMPDVSKNNKAKEQLATVEKEMAALAHVKESVDAIGGLGEERYSGIMNAFSAPMWEDFNYYYGELLNNPESAKDDPSSKENLDYAYRQIHQMVHANEENLDWMNADMDTIRKEGAAWWDIMQNSEDIARYGELEEAKTSLEKTIADTQKSVDEYNRQQEQWNERIAAYEAAGMDATGLKTAQAVTQSLMDFDKYEATVLQQYNSYDMMMREVEGGASFEDVKAKAEEENAKIQDALETARWEKEYIEENGIQIPENYMRNLDRYIAKLERYSTDYDYFVLQGESDFKELAEKGKEMEQSLPRGNRLDEEDENGYSLGQYMETGEKETYYYLLAKYGAEDLNAGFNEAFKYWGYLGDPEFGVLNARTTEAYREDARNFVKENPVLANGLAILAAPMEGVAGLAYLATSAAMGWELNPESPLLSLGYFSQTVNEETSAAIKDYFKDSPIAQELALGAYEILYNRGRSMANAAFTGGFHIGGRLGDVLTEIVGALPMAVGAGAMAAANAKSKGADDGPAYITGLITILMESGTEGLTRSNIMKAFGKGGEEGKRAIKDLVVDWMTRSGLEEAFGETLTDYVEGYVDKELLSVTGNSDHQQRVNGYIEELGLDPSNPLDLKKAEELANQDEINGLIRTAIISYISPSTDIATSVISDSINDFKNIRNLTKEYQQQGYNVSMNDVRKEYKAWKEAATNGTSQGTQEGEAQQTAQEAPAEQAATPQAPKRKASAEDTAFLSDLGKLDAVTNSDTTTQAAAIGAIFGGEQNTISWDQAKAAATMLPNIFGSMKNTLNEVKGLIIAAHSGTVDALKVKSAVMTAALSPSSSAAAVIQSEEYQNASNVEQATMLADTVEADQANDTVAQETEKSVHENRTANIEAELTRNGQLDILKPLKDTLNSFDKMVEQAMTELGEKKEIFAERSKAVQQALNDLAMNASEENKLAFQKANDSMNAAHELTTQAEDHLKAVQRQKDAAEEKYKGAKDAEIARMRQQAETEIAKQDQERLDEINRQAQELVAQQQAENDRLAQEQAEQEARQAEEDEKTGAAQEAREDAMIEAALDNENLEEGEERDSRREALKNQRDKIKFSKVDLGGSVNNTEGFLAISAFARKTGLKFELKEMDPSIRGQYNNGTVYLNANRIKSGNMSVGQALVEAALHEITHGMENLGAYKGYRKVVLESLFGVKNAGDAKSLYNSNAEFRAMVDDIRTQRKNGVTKEDLDIEGAEKEIIADFARTRLNQKEVIDRFMDAGLGGQMRNTLHNINQSLKNFFDRKSGKSYQQYVAGINEYNAREGVSESDQITAKSEEDFYKEYEYLRRAERAYQKALNELAKTDAHPDSQQFSVQQMAEATKMGMVCNDDTLQLFIPDPEGKIVGDGKNGMEEGVRYSEVDGVKVKITPDMIVNTPVGMLIDMGLSDEEFTGEDGKTHSQKADARQMFADLMNLCARYKDNNLIWEIAGSEFSEAFSALKSNSDPQYKNTVDFGTICAKTQGIIDVLSETMLDRIAKARKWNEDHAQEIKDGKEKEKYFTGLTREDIMMVYDKTHNAGLSVPCPVCYVFSRWMGVPSLLGQMNRFQHEFVTTKTAADGSVLYDENGDAVIDWVQTKKDANDYIHEMLGRYGSKDKIADEKNKLNNKIRTRIKNLPKLSEKMLTLQDELSSDTLTKKDRKKKEGQLARTEAAIKKNIAETDQFTEEIKKFEGFNWVTQALCLQHQEGNSRVNDLDENGDYIVDEKNFRLTPEEILFDLNRTGEFAGYAKNWSYRTTRGAGMGKAIMPYSGSSIGDIIHGDAIRWQTSQNPFLNMDEAAAKKAFDNAKKRVRQQNLVGGQRFQSTSDFRPEWGLDYIMSFLEMQALGSKVQMYTKVAEAVDFLGSIGADVNLSIMAHDNGFHEATAEEIEQAKTDKELASRMGTLDGKTYVMEFSDVTGMDYNTAKAKTKKFNNVQMILVGMNDMHIKLAIQNADIDFVIPWHSSGNSKDVLQQLVASVGEALNESSDYTDTQTDQIKSHKEGKGKNEKTIDDRTQTEIDRWNARIKILTGVANKSEEDGGFTKEERKMVYADKEWLGPLYDRFYVEGVDADCFGVALPTAQAEQIFPYEYWDKTSTRENADVNGERFATYCDSLGLVPRFSQFKDVSGYWKLLIDRKMYDNNVLNDDGSVKEYGKYREQKVVDVTSARIDNDPNATLDDKQFRAKQVYQLPESTTAKYGKKNYAEETQEAIRAASNALSEKYDVSGRYSAYGDTTEADRAIMRDAAKDYQDAVDRGDMEAAQQDVDFAAEQAGFDTEDAYHGTESFGFTEFNMGASQDQIFVAYNKKTASTYTPIGDVRDIGRPKGNIDNLSNKEIAERINELPDMNFLGDNVINADVISQNEMQSVLSGVLDDALSLLNGIEFNDISGRFGDGVDIKEQFAKTAANRFGDDEAEWMNCNTPKDMASLFIEKFIGEGNFEVKTNHYNLLDTLLLYFCEPDNKLFNQMSLLNHYNDLAFNEDAPDGIFRLETYMRPGENIPFSYETRYNILDWYDRASGYGIYKFYTRPGNQLVVDANTARWNRIPTYALIEATGGDAMDWEDQSFGDYLTTRQVAKAAKAHGYDSVRINNVYDHGGRRGGSLEDAYGDIGIFFNQQDVKSADAVTYDENGNVIPLDQRFTDSNDLRYSTGGEKTMADIEMEVDQFIEDYIGSLSFEEVEALLRNELPSREEAPTETNTNKAATTPVSELRSMYIDAMNRGDTAAMRDIVDKIAKKAGYTVRGTHRTNADFTVFERNETTGKNGATLGDGFYVAAGERTEYDSDTYGKKRMLVYIKPGKVFDIQKGGLTRQQAKKVYDKYFAPLHPSITGYDNPYTEHVLTQLQKEWKVMDYMKEAAEKNNTTTSEIFKWLGYNSIKDGPQYCVFDSEQIKSAEPVTYADNGEAIPISERFNRKEKDYRYSTGGEQTEADMIQTLVEAGVITQEEVDEYAQYSSGEHEMSGAESSRNGYVTGMINDTVGYTAKDGYVKFDNAPNDNVIKNLESIGMIYNPASREWATNGRKLPSDYIVKTIENGNKGMPAPSLEQFNANRQTTRQTKPPTAAEVNRSEAIAGTAAQLEGYNPLATNAVGEAQRAFGQGMLQDSDEIAREAKALVLAQNGRGIDTNAEQIDRAIKWIRSNKQTPNSDGLYEAVQKITSNDFDYRSADGQARMVAVMGMAVAKGDTMTQVALADAFNRQGTDLGRALQARKLFRLMTPEGRISTLQKMLQNTQDQLNASGTNVELKFSDWIYRAAAAATEEGDYQKVQDAAAEELARQIPVNWRDRLTAWRMLSMLGNPRTHIRNVLGNAFFMPIVGVKNKVAAIGELATKKENRTKTIGFATQDARNFAKQYASQIKNTLTGEAKYKDGSLVQQQRKIFGTKDGIISRTAGKVLQSLVDANGRALEWEDWIFLNRHFRNSLAGYMTARGLTSADMTGNTLEQATTYAVQEAQKATYRDANKVASKLSDIGRSGGIPGFAVNAVLPFKKTPANILRRGIEYSPAGLIKSLILDSAHVKEYMDYKNGKLKALPEKAISPNQWIDKIASGLTGTAIAAAGYLLSSLGCVRAGFDDDDDEFDKLRGEQEYSLNLFGNDVSMTIDWAAPMSMPFFVGATIFDTIDKLADGEDIDIAAVADSILNITEPVFNLSMLDGVNSLLDVNSYGGGNPITKIAEKVVSNYATSFVPTLAGQAARTIDTTRRKSYVESGASLSTFRYAWEQTENKIPFLSKSNIPYRNAWGEASTEDNQWLAGLENFLSPAYFNEIKDDAVTNELERLYNSVRQDYKSSMVPKMPSKTVGDMKLNAEQYDQLTVERGQTAKKVLTDLMNAPEYALADDDTRAEMIKDIWTYTNQISNHNINADQKVAAWIDKAQKEGNIVGTVIDRAIKRNKDDQASWYTDALKDSFGANNLEDAQTSIAGLRRVGKSNSSIKTTVTNYYKPLYQEAYRNGDGNAMFEIESMLDALDEEIKWKYSDWLKNADAVEEPEEEQERQTEWLNKNNR